MTRPTGSTALKCFLDPRPYPLPAIAFAACLAATLALNAPPASAQVTLVESSSCSSVNGATVCLEGGGWLTCTAENTQASCEGSEGMRCEADAAGAMTCEPPAGGSCEVLADRTVCTTDGRASEAQ